MLDIASRDPETCFSRGRSFLTSVTRKEVHAAHVSSG